MKFVNGWASKKTQWDKIELRIRFGAIDFFRVKYDHSDKYFEFRVLNFGGKVGGKRK